MIKMVGAGVGVERMTMTRTNEQRIFFSCFPSFHLARERVRKEWLSGKQTREP